MYLRTDACSLEMISNNNASLRSSSSASTAALKKIFDVPILYFEVSSSRASIILKHAFRPSMYPLGMIPGVRIS